MAALDFPAAPSVDDLYSANGRIFRWNGETWRAGAAVETDEHIASVLLLVQGVGGNPMPVGTITDAAVYTLGGDFTIECFDVTFTAATAGTIFSHYNATGNQRSWLIDYDATNLRFVGSTNGTATVILTHTWTPTLATPYQIAVDRSGTTARLYLDGTQVDSDTLSGSLHNTTANLTIGTLNGASAFPGTATAVRLTNGAARYAGAYTPPSLPLLTQ